MKKAWGWLRSPGYIQQYAAYVNYDGLLQNYYVSSETGCVRPAFWLDLVVAGF